MAWFNSIRLWFKSFFVVGLSIFLCSACTQKLYLTPSHYQPKSLAKSQKSYKYYVDSVKIPFLKQNYVGKNKNYAGDYLSSIILQNNLADWAENEIITFLKRHNHTVIDDISKADFIFICDIDKLNLNKENVWNVGAYFSCSFYLSIQIKNIKSDQKIYSRTLEGHHRFLRTSQKNNSISDGEALNYCAGRVFQTTLEKIKL